MARPGPQTHAKRQREQAKREKRRAKAEKMALRKAQRKSGEDPLAYLEEEPILDNGEGEGEGALQAETQADVAEE